MVIAQMFPWSCVQMPFNACCCCCPTSTGKPWRRCLTSSTMWPATRRTIK